MDDDAKQQALLSALVTEHFVLQSARGVATSEAASRSSLYLTFLSGALIALGFIAQVAGRFDTFAAAVVPAIVVLGEFTYVRLLENSIEDVLFQRRINWIRRYYLGLHPDAAQFFGDVLRDTRSSPVLYHSSLQMLLTAASMVAAVNSMVVGTGWPCCCGRSTWPRLPPPRPGPGCWSRWGCSPCTSGTSATTSASW
jgi:hypothetical protein